MKRVVIIFSFLVFCFSSVYSQTDSLSFGTGQPVKNLDFSIETGTSIISSKNIGSAGFMYVAPGLKLNATPKLSFNLKTYFFQPAFSNIQSLNSMELAYEKQSQQMVSIYAEGEYKINEKLHVKGYWIKNQPQYNNIIYDPVRFTNFYNSIQNAYSVGMYYQITRNIQIGGEFRIVEYTPNNMPMLYY